MEQAAEPLRSGDCSGDSAEAVLRRSEASFRTLIERLPDAVLVHHQGKVALASLRRELVPLLGEEQTAALFDQTDERGPVDANALVDRAHELIELLDRIIEKGASHQPSG